MKVEKITLTELNRAYATAALTFEGRPFVLYASESTVGVPGKALAYDLERLEEPEIVWEDAGGCMEMMAHPLIKDTFLAVQEFYLKENPSRARIVCVKREAKGQWHCYELVKLPLVHRFGVFKEGDKAYLAACTVAREKQDKDDWSQSGEIWVGELPAALGEPMTLECLASGYFRNHGFYQYRQNNHDVLCIGSDQGAFEITHDKEGFKIRKLLEGAIGEVALHDLDGDGKLELMTIEPFHGNQIKLYHINEQGMYQQVWQAEGNIEFAHALCGGTLLNKPCFVAGVRKGSGDTFALFYENGVYKSEKIDCGNGAANVCIAHHQGVDYVGCANHTIHECALYKISE